MQIDAGDIRAPGAWVCSGCAARFERDDYPHPDIALEKAKDHTLECEGEDPEPRYDPDLDEEDYAVDFQEVSVDE